MFIAKKVRFISIAIFLRLCFIFLLSSNFTGASSNKYLEDLSSEFITGEEDYKAEVIVRLNYEGVNENVEVKSDEELIKLREDNKAYHTAKNEKILATLPNLNVQVEISSYAPFLFISYETYAEYKNDELNLKRISNCNAVEYVSVESTKKTETNINPSKSKVFASMQEARNIINYGSTSYTGKGIKVGVLDDGAPLLETIAKKNIKKTCKYIEYYDKYHTSRVLSFLCGEFGLATDVDIYLYSFNEKGIIYYENMLNDGVNIISISVGYSEGVYTNLSAYLDYLVAHNNVCIVKAAGNKSTSKYVTSPGTGLNVITVGSIDKNKNISYFSSYKVKNEYSAFICKPNLVAPGENIDLIINGTKHTSTGTSYSTPIVSSVIAMLMEEFSILKYNPHLLNNILIHSATKLPSQSATFDEAAGAGIVNYLNSREVAKSYINKDGKYKFESWEISQCIEKEVVAEFSIYFKSDTLLISLVGCADLYASYDSIEQNVLPKSSKFFLEIYDDSEYIVDQLYSKGNLLKEISSLEVGRTYRIYVYTMNTFPNVSERLSIITSFI